MTAMPNSSQYQTRTFVCVVLIPNSSTNQTPKKRVPITKATNNSPFPLYFLYTCHLPAHHRGSSPRKISTLPNAPRRTDFILSAILQLHRSHIRLPNAIHRSINPPSPPSNNLSKAKHNSCSYHCNWVERDSAEKKWDFFPHPIKNLPFHTGKTDSAFFVFFQ